MKQELTNRQLGKILVVDDEVELQKILVDTLGTQGYETVGQTSAHDALKALREKAFDVLLTDLMMPEMDGITLLKASLEIDPHLIGIVMTGQGTIQTAVDAMKVGAFDYVLKPFRLQVLLPVLTRAMSARRLQLENLQLRETVAMYGLSQAIAFTLDPQTLISKLADAALQQTDADEVSILLPARDRDELYVAAVRGENRQRLLGETVPLEESISGWVAREREPLLLEGEISDRRFRSLWPHPEICSAISIPMQVAGKLVGVINVNALSRARAFTLGQMKALTILASTAAAGLETAALYVQVRQAEEDYHSIFEHAVEGIFRISPDGKFITANPAMAHLLGYGTPQELMAAVTDVKQQLYVDQDRQLLWEQRLRQGEKIAGFETQYRRKDGSSVWLSESAHAVFDVTGKVLYYEGIAEDITERKHLEDQLRQSQKMEAVGQLAGGVAHDFNNLLTAINGYSSLMLQRLPEDHPLRNYLEEIKKAGERAANLTRQLLAFGRKQMLQPLAINLNDVVTDLSKMLRRLIGEDVQLDTKLSAALKRIKADPGQVEQVIVNLVVNARDAMPQGGSLLIETANVELDQEYTGRHVGVHPGSYVMLAVSDTGQGMDEETRKRIFEPFFTTKEKGKGTGLGLSTVYGIVRQSGGDIWVYSEPGKGTTFKIYFPQLEAEPPTLQGTIAETVMVGGSETILLVEDEEVVRGLARQILEQAGYQVLEVEQAADAVSLGAETEDPIHLLLTDVVMPGVSGKDVADRLSELRPGIKVLFMSGYTDEAIVHHGVLDSNVQFIQKPFTPAVLLRKVREVLSSEINE